MQNDSEEDGTGEELCEPAGEGGLVGCWECAEEAGGLEDGVLGVEEVDVVAAHALAHLVVLLRLKRELTSIHRLQAIKSSPQQPGDDRMDSQVTAAPANPPNTCAT